MTGVEAGGNLLVAEDRDVVGEQAVERECGTIRRRPGAVHRHRRDVGQRMDTCVRTPGYDEIREGGPERTERAAQRPLDRPLAGLAGPAAKPGAVVLERELEREVVRRS